ncbi:hypothetical protein AYO20_01142 [Fonsecaea nubica]|uniref:Isochorismatase-like domain-containing protein n=1 Tax=Fonsecaea nubica TaxID=856822 RepID=A0A178DF99_9EURO|nr:hypothetical protein AYO20_01142 [Fonsecaea nubica]OAL39745.1 hypothetical protein AYO20_01142 [Fonsecaea nubica]
MSSTESTSPPPRRHLSPASETRTALLLIDIQRGLNTHNGYFGSERSTPDLEKNVSALLAAARGYNSSVQVRVRVSRSHGQVEDHSTSPSPVHSASNGERNVEEGANNDSEREPYAVEIVHVYHKSTNPLSPLHVSGTTQRDGIKFMPCAEPVTAMESSEAATLPREHVLSKSTNTAFGNAELKEILERGRIEQLVVAGIATDHCVTTSVRWAKDLGVVKKRPGQGERREDERGENGTIVILSDATACFNKGGFDAETVQKVHLASLEGEFATVMTTNDVLDQLFG